MVFQKKATTPAKNFQPKKKGKKQVEADDDDSDMFNDMDDSDDFEDDSGDDIPVQKTPQNKTPKGRQSLSEKKVTFDMSAKNTPGKTPNKNNSLVGKKTPTPAKGKGGLQEFKGIKGGKSLQKKGGADDDDDDDEDDDDDDEDDDDLDIDLGDDDDDDDEEEEEEDDDDDDEDEDDDDEDEEEEEEPKPKMKQANKNQKNEQNKQKTPVKTENSKNQTPKSKTPKNEVKEPASSLNAETQSIEIQRRRERDAKMLYVGGLPTDVTTEELQALSPDIKNVIIPKSNRKNVRNAFGFLCFASEAKAEANYKTLQGKKFRGQLMNIDFVGEKSKKKPISLEPKINERKLYVTGIPLDATVAQIATFFPKAYQVTFNKSPSFRSASINFEKIEDANEAFKANKNVEINGQKLIVVHSVISTMNKKQKKRKPHKNNAKQGGSPAKKMKFTKQEKESSDEE